MIARLLRIAWPVLMLGQMVVTSFDVIADEARPDAPPWLSNVPALSFGGHRAFQFRTRKGGSILNHTFYISWAPPDHRAMVFCDSSDGLPLVYIVDGDAWVYDLISGQIIHFKLEPWFKFNIDGGQCNFGWGAVLPDKEHGIHVDFVSFLKAPSIVSIKATTEATRRAALGMTARGSKVLLEVRSSDPPLPERFVFSVPDPMVGQIECDQFRYDEALPSWHRTLDPAMLAKDVPYLDGTDLKDMPEDRAELLTLVKQLLSSETTFLIRPALRDPAFRAKFEEKFSKIDFKQIELHEKLLRDAWLRALQHQGCDPTKSFAPTPTE